MREPMSQEIKHRLTRAADFRREACLWEAVSSKLEELWAAPNHLPAAEDHDLGRLPRDERVRLALACDLQLVGLAFHNRLVHGGPETGIPHADAAPSRECEPVRHQDSRARAFDVLAGDVALHAARTIARSVRTTDHTDHLDAVLSGAAARLLAEVTEPS